MNIHQIKDNILALARDTYISGIFLLIVLGIIIPFFVSSLYFSSQIYATLENNIFSLLLIIVFSIFLIKYLYKINLSDRSWFITLILLIVVSAVARLIFAFSFEQEYYSDFRTMWNYACRVGSEGVWTPPDRAQTERPLPIFVPLTYLFGCGDWVFKCFNVFALTIQNTLIAIIIKKIVSNPASILAFLFLSMHPESYFASLIPTHDIPGSFFIILYIFLFFLVLTSNYQMKLWTLIGIGLSLGIVGTLLHIQRGIFYPLWFSTILFLFFCTCFIVLKKNNVQYFKTLILCAIFPFIIFILSTTALTYKSIMYDRNDPHSFQSISRLYSLSHTMVDGTYSGAITFFGKYGHSNNYSDNLFYARAFFLTDFYRDILHRPANWLERIKRVSSFGTQGGFYYGRLQNLSDIDVKHYHHLFAVINAQYNFVFAVLSFFAIILLFSAKRIFYNIHFFCFLPLVFASTCILLIGLIGETQPRYLFFLPFTIAIPLFAVVDIIHNKSNNLAGYIDKTNFRLGGFLIVIFCILLFFFLSKYCIKKSPYLLSDMSNPVIECVGIPANTCQNSRIIDVRERDVRHHSNLTLHHPVGLNRGDAVRAIYNFQPIDIGVRKIFTVYVQTPYKREDGRTGFFDVNIYANGVLREKLHLSDTDNFKLVKFEVEGNGGPLEIIFESVSNVDFKSASWIRASTVHFRFLALRNVTD